MATVRNTPASVQPAESWPACTDLVRAELPASDWPSWSDMIVPGPIGMDDGDDRGGDGPPPAPPEGPTVTPLAWIEGEAASHRCREEVVCAKPIGMHGLVAGELESLAGTWAFYRAVDTFHFLTARPFILGYDGLAGVRARVPAAGARESTLAREIDRIAEGYLAIGSDLATLVAGVLANLADDCEGYGSSTAEDYLIDEAAARSAAIDEICDRMS